MSNNFAESTVPMVPNVITEEEMFVMYRRILEGGQSIPLNGHNTSSFVLELREILKMYETKQISLFAFMIKLMNPIYSRYSKLYPC